MDIKEQTFAERMIEKYPELFPTNMLDDTIPPRSGFSCPKGWELLVENLMHQINRHLTQKHYVQSYKAYYTVCKFFYHIFLIRALFNWLSKITDPCRKIFKEKKMAHYYECEAVRKANPKRYKLHLFINKMWNCFQPKYHSKEVFIEPVTILQIKSKLASLRFYYTGGDAHVASIVAFAENFSHRICENTGAEGFLCNKDGYLKTLSMKECKKEKFKLYE